MEDDLFGNVIYAYTIEDGLADGLYQEVTWVAQQLGYRVPVFLTEGLTAHLGLGPEEKDILFSDRLTIFLAMASVYIAPKTMSTEFPVDFTYQDANIVCGLNAMTDGQPVLVFCLLEED